MPGIFGERDGMLSRWVTPVVLPFERDNGYFIGIITGRRIFLPPDPLD